MKRYRLSEEQLSTLRKIAEPQTYMVFGGHAPISQTERLCDAWRTFGEALGFDWRTVRQIGADLAEFEAEPIEPRLFIDGNKWCALRGENIQEGVAGFGDSPAEALSDFDAAWARKIGGV